jgi:large subunit ribosomal protein L13
MLGALFMKTFVLKAKDIHKRTYLVDAKGKILGRMATRVATLLMGKHKPEYTPFLDCGDQVVVINAREIGFTGRKGEQKMYKRYTGYPGGIRSISLDKLLEEKPEEVVSEAIRRMLPHTKLGDKMLRHLRVYAGAEHRQAAQNPIPYEY